MHGCPPGIETRRDFERWLHRHGFSCTAAKRLSRSWGVDELAAADRLLLLTAELQSVLEKTKTACYDLESNTPTGVRDVRQ